MSIPEVPVVPLLTPPPIEDLTDTELLGRLLRVADETDTDVDILTTDVSRLANQATGLRTKVRAMRHMIAERMGNKRANTRLVESGIVYPAAKSSGILLVVGFAVLACGGGSVPTKPRMPNMDAEADTFIVQAAEWANDLDFAKAAAYYRKAAEAGADKELALGKLAECYYRLDMPDDALRVCDDLDRDRASAASPFVRGLIARKSGNMVEARSQFERAAARGHRYAAMNLRSMMEKGP